MLKKYFTLAINRFENFINTIAVICLNLIMVLLCIEITLRKTIQFSIPGLVDIVEEYLLVALVFLSMSYIYRKGGHVRVLLFRRFLPDKIKRPVDTFLNFLGLIYFGLIAIYGWQNTLRALKFNEVSACILEYPLAPAYFLVTVGSGLLCIRIFQYLFSVVEESEGEEL